jgi:hypothetical protein
MKEGRDDSPGTASTMCLPVFNSYLRQSRAVMVASKFDNRLKVSFLLLCWEFLLFINVHCTVMA